MTDPDRTPLTADPLQSNEVAPPDAAQGADAAPGSPEAAPVTPQVTPGAGLRYAALRLLMLVTVGGILYLVGMRGWALLFTAVLLSAIVSWFVFMRQREAAARNIEARVTAHAARRNHADATEGDTRA